MSLHHSTTITRLAAFSRTTWIGRYQKDTPFWILLKQRWWSSSGINWTICSTFAPCSMPTPHHSSLLQARWSSCRPTNSVKALQAHPCITLDSRATYFWPEWNLLFTCISTWSWYIILMYNMIFIDHCLLCNVMCHYALCNYVVPVNPKRYCFRTSEWRKSRSTDKLWFTWKVLCVVGTGRHWNSNACAEGLQSNGESSWCTLQSTQLWTAPDGSLWSCVQGSTSCCHDCSLCYYRPR